MNAKLYGCFILFVLPAWANPKYIEERLFNGNEVIFALDVDQDQEINLIFGIDGPPVDVEIQLTGRQQPIRFTTHQNLDCRPFQFRFDRDGKVVVRISAKTWEPRERGYAWLDYRIWKSDEPLQPNTNTHHWITAFEQFLNWSQGLEDADSFPDTFLSHGFHREAMATAYLVSERLWSQAKRLEARNGLSEVYKQVEEKAFLPLLARLAYRLGKMETDLSFFSQAATRFKAAIAIRKALKMPLAEGLAHHGLGFTNVVIQDLDQAEADYGRALQLYKGKGTASLWARMELTWVERHRGNFDNAIVQFRKLLPDIENTNDELLKLEIYDRLGSTLGLKGQVDEGKKALLHSLGIARRLKHNRALYQATAWINLAYLTWINSAHLNKHQENLEDALHYISSAEASYPPNIVQEGRFILYWLKGSIQRDLGQKREALKSYERSISIAEKVREKSNRGREDLQFFQDSFEYFEDIFQLCWALHNASPTEGFDRKAFQLWEQIRSGYLYQNPTNSAQIEEDDIADIRPIDLLVGGAGASHFNPQPNTIPASQASLDSLMTNHFLETDQGLIAYFLGKKQGYWWLLTQDNLVMGLIPQIEALKNLFEAFSSEVKQPAPRLAQINQLLKAIEHKILPPGENLEPLKHLYIFPDGILYRLPFVMLPQMQGREDTDQNLTSLSYLHDASMGLQLKKIKERTWANRRMLVISDPIFEETDSRLKRQNQGEAPSQKGLFPRLKESANEARWIEAMTNGSTFEALSGFEASLKHFLAKPLEQYQLLHFATHAICVTEQPGKSGLLFCLLDESGQNQDGYLTVKAISELKLNADLVVLSACRTGDGPIFLGEGIMGLGQAFLEAGALGVVASLWDIEDKASARFMRFFYEALVKGEDAAKALRLAQTHMQATRTWSAPRYWAGFSLIGLGKKIF